MSNPRSAPANSDVPGFYHCVGQITRRPKLAAEGPDSDDDPRARIEGRLLELAESFAVAIYAWSVMGDEVHVVLRLVPQAAEDWSDEEVARRWARLSEMGKEVDEQTIVLRVQLLLKHPDVLNDVRLRLASLQWFMGMLDEEVNGEHGDL